LTLFNSRSLKIQCFKFGVSLFGLTTIQVLTIHEWLLALILNSAVLEADDTEVTKAEDIPCSPELTLLWERETMNK
jgi:hypothetical protein